MYTLVVILIVYLITPQDLSKLFFFQRDVFTPLTNKEWI